MSMVEIETHGEAETKLAGRIVAEILVERGGGVVALSGELGAGKTVFVKGMAEGLGIDPRDVVSPTFVLAMRHEGAAVLWHLDAYRLDCEQFMLSCGEAFEEDGIVAVEWADRVEAALPQERVCVEIEHKGEGRRLVRISADSDFEALLRQRLAR
ncbi:MAG: tRNA (adenosine(37)-N6)-threonylcarbamoyltransferase complex ATPase subunit type 1 TsaE [Planctomycetota bacterium]|nr:MAG: tRNA (adenosine(37)-N6)-threonylcarbamoyltransferase complex ATPase subunit type 1 TsaE [Planctomycetota bacterium]